MKRIAILMAIACLALPVTAGAQDHGHRDGGRGESHDRGGGDERRGGDRDRSDRGGGDRGGGYRDERGYRGGPGPGYGDPGPRGGNYGSRGYGGGAPRSYRFVRGQQLPPEYRGYVVGDYERYTLGGNWFFTPFAELKFDYRWNLETPSLKNPGHLAVAKNNDAYVQPHFLF